LSNDLDEMMAAEEEGGGGDGGGASGAGAGEMLTLPTRMAVEALAGLRSEVQRERERDSRTRWGVCEGREAEEDDEEEMEDVARTSGREAGSGVEMEE
jgi:hypothetical protein